MLKYRALIGLWTATCLTMLASPCFAQEIDQSKDFGEYTVYYNLVNSTFLPAEVAERYGVSRSEDRAVLTVSVRAANGDGEVTDQPAEVSGTAADMVHLYPLDFDEHREPQAVYYLAEVPAHGRTRLDFSINVKPRDSKKTYELEFSESLFPPAGP